MTCPQLRSTRTTHRASRLLLPCALCSQMPLPGTAHSTPASLTGQFPSDSGSLAEAGQVLRWSCINNQVLVGKDLERVPSLWNGNGANFSLSLEYVRH